MSSLRLNCRPQDAARILRHHLKDCRFSERSIADMQILTFSRRYNRIGKELTAVFTITPDNACPDGSILHLSITGMSAESCSAIARHICAGEMAATVKFDLGASSDMLGGLMSALEAYRT